jgi:hypothetical protein
MRCQSAVLINPAFKPMIHPGIRQGLTGVWLPRSRSMPAPGLHPSGNPLATPARTTSKAIAKQIKEGGGKATLTTVEGGTATVTIANVFQSSGVLDVIDTVLMANLFVSLVLESRRSTSACFFLVPSQMTGAPYLARFSRDVGFHRC